MPRPFLPHPSKILSKDAGTDQYQLQVIYSINNVSVALEPLFSYKLQTMTHHQAPICLIRRITFIFWWEMKQRSHFVYSWLKNTVSYRPCTAYGSPVGWRVNYLPLMSITYIQALWRLAAGCFEDELELTHFMTCNQSPLPLHKFPASCSPSTVLGIFCVRNLKIKIQLPFSSIQIGWLRQIHISCCMPLIFHYLSKS